jgi:hypothetical protein
MGAAASSHTDQEGQITNGAKKVEGGRERNVFARPKAPTTKAGDPPMRKVYHIGPPIHKQTQHRKGDLMMQQLTPTPEGQKPDLELVALVDENGQVIPTNGATTTVHLSIITKEPGNGKPQQEKEENTES